MIDKYFKKDKLKKLNHVVSVSICVRIFFILLSLIFLLPVLAQQVQRQSTEHRTQTARNQDSKKCKGRRLLCGCGDERRAVTAYSSSEGKGGSN